MALQRALQVLRPNDESRGSLRHAVLRKCVPQALVRACSRLTSRRWTDTRCLCVSLETLWFLVDCECPCCGVDLMPKSQLPWYANRLKLERAMPTASEIEELDDDDPRVQVSACAR